MGRYQHKTHAPCQDTDACLDNRVPHVRLSEAFFFEEKSQREKPMPPPEQSDRFESKNLQVARMCAVIVLLDSCSHFLLGAERFLLRWITNNSFWAMQHQRKALSNVVRLA